MNRLRIKHMTGFHYKGDVTASYNEARMLPASTEGQLVLFSNLDILPISSQHSYVDYWGTRVSSFEILTPHKELALTATSLVEVRAREHPEHRLNWEDLVKIYLAAPAGSSNRPFVFRALVLNGHSVYCVEEVSPRAEPSDIANAGDGVFAQAISSGFGWGEKP